MLFLTKRQREVDLVLKLSRLMNLNRKWLIRQLKTMILILNLSDLQRLRLKSFKSFQRLPMFTQN